MNSYTVVLHWGNFPPHAQPIYQGTDETIMYSHVSAIEYTLIACHGTAEIEIIETGDSRWIEYRNGERI